jgi:hypothetical protein
LTKTLTTPTNNQKWTFSEWVKRSSFGANQFILQAGDASNEEAQWYFTTSDTIRFYNYTGSYQYDYTTVQVFRDPSAWYHIVVAYDSTQATAANRFKVYINGSEITLTRSNDVALNATNSKVNSAVSHDIGGSNIEARWFNGYLTEINFIDGSALDPSSFGEFNSDTGVWQPIEYTGTYGTNGFYLNFSDNTSTTTLGDDFSGNGNDWTTNNFSVTAGAGNDSLVDSPTRYGTDTGAGGQVRGNYCTLNPLTLYGGNSVCQDGNLYLTASTSGDGSVNGTIAMRAGEKYYFEAIYNEAGGSGGQATLGITSKLFTGAFSKPGSSAGEFAFDFRGSAGTPEAKDEGSLTTYGTQPNNGDVVGIAVDLSTGKFYAHKANSYYNSGDPVAGTGAVITGIPTDLDYLPHIGLDGGPNNNDWVLNFGQRPFAYTAPSGFKALCTTNLPAPTIEDGSQYFDAVAYSGTGATQTITVDFASDFAWLKRRDGVGDNVLLDILRLTGSLPNRLFSNNTNAESTLADGQNSFSSTGIVLDSSGGGGGDVNTSGRTYVAWQWKANGAGVSNTDGTITSTVSVNTTSGFSIVTYTGTGSAATVGHGLGAVPRMIIVKSRDQGTTGYTGNWYVYHANNTAAPETDYLLLNTTAATADDTFWNDTLPTSSVFSVGALSGTNDSGDAFVAYCFSEVAGYSRFGSYTGNGNANGPFVYTGFRPAFLLIKRSSATENWGVWDSTRNPYNVSNRALLPSSNAVEQTDQLFDLLSNGFKARTTTNLTNISGQTYIYMALAESPFQYSLAR